MFASYFNNRNSRTGGYTPEDAPRELYRVIILNENDRLEGEHDRDARRQTTTTTINDGDGDDDDDDGNGEERTSIENGSLATTTDTTLTSRHTSGAALTRRRDAA